MLRRSRSARALGAAVAAGLLAVAALAPAAGAADDGDLGISALRHGHDRDHDHDGPKHPRAPRPGTVGAPVVTGLNAPFGVDVSRHGSVWVAETGTGDEANPA